MGGMSTVAYRTRTGFTLAELLIVLGVLGIIATFTIPKVLTSVQNKQWVALAKEDISTIAGAYQAYAQNNIANSSFTGDLLIPYINYASKDTSSTIDGGYDETTTTCSASSPCLKNAQRLINHDYARGRKLLGNDRDKLCIYIY